MNFGKCLAIEVQTIFIQHFVIFILQQLKLFGINDIACNFRN
jgi:hypothetical protein